MKPLDKFLKETYETIENQLQYQNVEFEREYENFPEVPFLPSLKGLSYYDIFESMKDAVKNPKTTESTIETIFICMEEGYLFSKGHDYMFKQKIKADYFQTLPIKNIIYPELEKEVKSKFNDFSIMEENPKKEENLNQIFKIMNAHLRFSMVLFMLYTSDWQFDGWETLTQEYHAQVLELFNTTKLTIGDFYYQLIEYKIAMMKDVLEQIYDSKMRMQFLKRLEKLKEEKQKEINTFAHKDLNVGFFLEHDFNDFLSIQINQNVRKKILDTTS